MVSNKLYIQWYYYPNDNMKWYSQHDKMEYCWIQATMRKKYRTGYSIVVMVKGDIEEVHSSDTILWPLPLHKHAIY